MVRKSIVLIVGLGLLVMGCASSYQARQPKPMKEDSVHVRTWNRFVDNLLTLHKQLIAKTPTTVTTKIGGYADSPKFYIEKDYRDSAGRVISRLQWEREHPDKLHTIEVYLYDQRGRVIRDYAGAYLPYYRHAPVQTLINFHTYNGQLHAFRSFDASGDMLYEHCEGNYAGKPVSLSLEFDDIYALEGKPHTTLTSRPYLACFKGMPKVAGNYLHPH